MSKFVQIPETAFEKLQLNAGVLLKAFNVKNASFENKDITKTAEKYVFLNGTLKLKRGGVKGAAA